MLAACSGPDRRTVASRAALRIDPCSLVTRAEAEALLGAPVAGPEKTAARGQFVQCRYLARGGPEAGRLTVQVHAVDLRSKRRAFKDSGEAARPVTGIGDEAFWAPAMGALYVGKGPVTASFAAAAPGVDARRASRSLALKGLARIP